jgi:hypothetical protein
MYKMDKQEFTSVLIIWLKQFIADKLSNYSLLEIITPESTLNRLNNANLRQIPHSATWEFMPNIVALLRNNETNSVETIFINRTTKSVSLREVGELKVYATIANPLFAFIASTKSSSTEVGLLMLEKDIRERCLNYDLRKSMFIFGWDEEKNIPLEDSIIPIERRRDLV